MIAVVDLGLNSQRPGDLPPFSVVCDGDDCGGYGALNVCVTVYCDDDVRLIEWRQCEAAGDCPFEWLQRRLQGQAKTSRV